MNVHLNVFICDKGVVTRNEFLVARIFESQLLEWPEYSNRITYGSDDLTDAKDKVLVWYTFSLEPYERDRNKEPK